MSQEVGTAGENDRTLTGAAKDVSSSADPKRKRKWQPKTEEAKRNKKATEKKHKKNGKKKSTTLCDDPVVIEDLLQQESIDHHAIVTQRYEEIYYGNLKDDDFARVIFDPLLENLATLPPGVLDQKEEVLPFGYTPRNKVELRAHCERLVILSRNKVLIWAIAEAWSGDGSGEDKFNRHLDDLWELRRSCPPLFRLFMSGRQADIVHALSPHRPSIKGFRKLDAHERVSIRRLLEHHALLWCCHDVQMVITRICVSDNPLGPLISTDKAYAALEAILNLNRERAKAAKKTIDAAARESADQGTYAGDPAWREQLVAADPELQIVAAKKKTVLARAEALKVDLSKLKGLDANVEQIARKLHGSNDAFMQHVGRDKTVNDKVTPRTFAALWYSGLPPLPACAVTVLRYIQAETDIKKLIDERIAQKGEKIEARESVALPAFNRDKLDNSREESLERARMLLNLYRRELLKDAQYQNRTKGTGIPGPLSLENVLKRSMQFLEAAKERNIGDDHGHIGSLKRTFYLLDVLPEHRLWLAML